jgi:hypothetical protein
MHLSDSKNHRRKELLKNQLMYYTAMVRTEDRDGFKRTTLIVRCNVKILLMHDDTIIDADCQGSLRNRSIHSILTISSGNEIRS